MIIAGAYKYCAKCWGGGCIATPSAHAWCAGGNGFATLSRPTGGACGLTPAASRTTSRRGRA